MKRILLLALLLAFVAGCKNKTVDIDKMNATNQAEIQKQAK